jgi:L-alanine-DL-glutamate epimerase-like enolase superfamily enzyme
VRVVAVRERTVPISRYASRYGIAGDLDTTAVAVVTDVVRDGEPVVGFGFSSIGRFGQAGLIRDRFAPRLLDADDDLASAAEDNIDPFRAWDRMMRGEKPGGHGERCVAVGTLDMALWDAAAKIAGRPLHAFLADAVGASGSGTRVPTRCAGSSTRATPRSRSRSGAGWPTT